MYIFPIHKNTQELKMKFSSFLCFPNTVTSNSIFCIFNVIFSWKYILPSTLYRFLHRAQVACNSPRVANFMHRVVFSSLQESTIDYTTENSAALGILQRFSRALEFSLQPCANLDFIPITCSFQITNQPIHQSFIRPHFWFGYSTEHKKMLFNLKMITMEFSIN